MIAFLKSRPTEVWLGLWSAIVVTLEGFNISIDARAASGIGMVVAWTVTILTNRAESWGPQ